MVSNLDVLASRQPVDSRARRRRYLEAARLQDLMFERGDDEGRLVWVRIRRAIEASPRVALPAPFLTFSGATGIGAGGW
jgi:hypothetical protein